MSTSQLTHCISTIVNWNDCSTTRRCMCRTKNNRKTVDRKEIKTCLVLSASRPLPLFRILFLGVKELSRMSHMIMSYGYGFCVCGEIVISNTKSEYARLESIVNDKRLITYFRIIKCIHQNHRRKSQIRQNEDIGHWSPVKWFRSLRWN